jgi:hypothetical protein
MKIDRRTYRLAALVLLVAVIAGGGAAWSLLGDSDVTPGAAAAFGIGGFVTVLLGGGLMAAIFLSDRAGFDQ